MLIKYTNLLMVLVILLMGAAGFFIGEKVTVNNGWGWDGMWYGMLSLDLYDKVFVRGVSEYRLQRILPSAVVHYGLRLFGIPLNARYIKADTEDMVQFIAVKEAFSQFNYIVRGFEAYNLIMLMLTAYAWGLIADALCIGAKGKWLGFTGLFLNFFMKYIFYLPVLTDATALAVGALLLLFYLKRNPLPIAFVSLLGAFTWPTMLYVGMLLLIFPAKKEDAQAAEEKAGLYVGLIIAFSVLLGAIYVRYILGYVYELGAPELTSLLVPSFSVLFFYLFFGLKELLKDGRLYGPKGLIKTVDGKGLLYALLIFFTVKVFLYRFGVPSDEPHSLFYHIKAILSLGINKPFIFGVAHVVFYGPVVLLTFFKWKQICAEMRNYGLGLTPVVFLGLMLGIGSESRQIVNFWPFFLAFTVKAMEGANLKGRHYLFFALLSFVYSRLWLKINTAPLPEWPERVYLDFPWQKFFMGVGYFMSTASYIIQGGVVFITGAVFFYFIRWKTKFT